MGIEKQGQIATHYLRGGLFENFIISEYRKMMMHQGKHPHLYFWRNNTGMEVDLIIEKTSSFSAVEIKAGATIKKEFTRSLTKFTSYANITRNRCHIVHTGEKSYQGKYMHLWNWYDYLATEFGY